jgi:hypothetical protein
MHGVAAELESLNRGGEAITLLDQVLERAAGKVVDPRLIPGVMHLRLLHFAKLNEAAGCRATAEMWEKFRHQVSGERLQVVGDRPQRQRGQEGQRSHEEQGTQHEDPKGGGCEQGNAP